MAASVDNLAPLLPKPGACFIFRAPAQAVGANLVYFDVFTLTVPMWLQSLEAIKDGSVAITGVVAVKLHATRTTTIGTGGTAAVNESATLTDTVFTASHLGLPIPAGLTARLTPGGGATGGAIIGEGQIYTEETAQTNYDSPTPLIDAPIFIPAGTGFRVIQSSVASVGNIGFRGILFPNS